MDNPLYNSPYMSHRPSYTPAPKSPNQQTQRYAGTSTNSSPLELSMPPKPSMTPARDKSPAHAAAIANSAPKNAQGKTKQYNKNPTVSGVS